MSRWVAASRSNRSRSWPGPGSLRVDGFDPVVRRPAPSVLAGQVRKPVAIPPHPVALPQRAWKG